MIPGVRASWQPPSASRQAGLSPGPRAPPCWLWVVPLSRPSRSAKFNNHPAPGTTKAAEFWAGRGGLPLMLGFLFSLSVGCVMKRWISCGRKWKGARRLSPLRRQCRLVWLQLQDFLSCANREERWFLLQPGVASLERPTFKSLRGLWQTSTVNRVGGMCV